MELTRDLRDQDLPTPNVYLATVQHGGAIFTTYVAADYSGAAIRKLQRWCVDNHGFRPNRANSDTKLRRFRLGDYLECPEGLQVALENAVTAHERDTAQKLTYRRTEVDDLLSGFSDALSAGHDVEAIEAMMAAELRAMA